MKAKLLAAFAALMLSAISSPVFSQQGFIYSGENYTLLPYGTQASGINDVGDVVGYYGLPPINTTVNSGFIYQDGTITTILNYPYAASTDVTEISASGELVGAYFNRGQGTPFGFTYSGANFDSFSFHLA